MHSNNFSPEILYTSGDHVSPGRISCGTSSILNNCNPNKLSPSMHAPSERYGMKSFRSTLNKFFFASTVRYGGSQTCTTLCFIFDIR